MNESYVSTAQRFLSTVGSGYIKRTVCRVSSQLDDGDEYSVLVKIIAFHQSPDHHLLQAADSKRLARPGLSIRKQGANAPRTREGDQMGHHVINILGLCLGAEHSVHLIDR